MVKEAKPKRKHKPSRRRPADETIYYVIEIADWEWGFMFGVNNMPRWDDPYSDFRHLILAGTLLRPVATKTQSVQLTLMPDERLNREARQRNSPTQVGSIRLYRGQFEALLPIPADVLPPVLTMLTAGLLKFAVLTGEKLRYGHSSVRNFRLEMKLNSEDLPNE